MNGRQAAASGVIIFAALVMIINGIWNFFLGLAGIIKSDYFVVGSNYAYRINVTGWGWIHLAIGIIVTIIGIALLSGQAWARWVTVIFAALQACWTFFYIPYYPLWMILIIVLDILVIWALAAYNPERVA